MKERDPGEYEWLILPGRKVCHAINWHDNKGYSLCGHSSGYPRTQLKEPLRDSPRCEQCLITIVSQIHAMTYKFFVAHVPPEIRAKRRKFWREYRKSLVIKNNQP